VFTYFKLSVKSLKQMSEDLTKVVEELISSGKGDLTRLQNILELLRRGTPISDSDQDYIESISGKHEFTANDLPVEVPTDIPVIPKDYSSDNPGFMSEIPTDTPVETPDNDNAESNTRDKKTNTKKRVISIAVIAAIIIISYTVLDVYAVNSLQFRPHRGTQAIISDTEISIQSDACNPSYFPVSFSKYQITAFYKSEVIETATIGGGTLSPKSASTFDGIFALNKDVITKYQNTSEQFNASNAQITTKVYAPIFGFIPYAVEKNYGADQFQKIIKNGPPELYSCQ